MMYAKYGEYRRLQIVDYVKLPKKCAADVTSYWFASKPRDPVCTKCPTDPALYFKNNTNAIIENAIDVRCTPGVKTCPEADAVFTNKTAAKGGNAGRWEARQRCYTDCLRIQE